MFRICVFVVACFAVTSAGVPQQHLKVVVPEQESQSSHALEVHGGYESAGYDGGQLDVHLTTGIGANDHGKGNSGAELTSLAHSSAVQAKNAVRSQHTAGSQAAFGIKSSLATAAVGAAQTAQAALVGKQAIVQNLKKQAFDAQNQLQAEIAQFHQLEGLVQISAEASQDAHAQVNTLTAAVAAAQAGAAHAEQAAAAAANAAASQHAMVDEAKQTIANILVQLQNASGDLQETEASAAKAAEAAQIAQSNAAAAGLAVAAASVKGGHHGGEESRGFHHY